MKIKYKLKKQVEIEPKIATLYETFGNDTQNAKQ